MTIDFKEALFYSKKKKNTKTKCIAENAEKDSPQRSKVSYGTANS